MKQASEDISKRQPEDDVTGKVQASTKAEKDVDSTRDAKLEKAEKPPMDVTVKMDPQEKTVEDGPSDAKVAYLCGVVAACNSRGINPRTLPGFDKLAANVTPDEISRYNAKVRAAGLNPLPMPTLSAPVKSKLPKFTRGGSKSKPAPKAVMQAKSKPVAKPAPKPEPKADTAETPKVKPRAEPKAEPKTPVIPANDPRMPLTTRPGPNAQVPEPRPTALDAPAQAVTPAVVERDNALAGPELLGAGNIAVPPNWLSRAGNWINKNRLQTGVGLAAAGGGAYALYKLHKYLTRDDKEASVKSAYIAGVTKACRYRGIDPATILS